MLGRMAAHFSDGRLDAIWFPRHELTYEQVAEFRTQLGRQYAPRTANNYLSALKAVLRGMGIRRAEAASLDLAAYAPFRSQLTVEHGKGRRERVVFLPSWVIAEVGDWLDWLPAPPVAQCRRCPSAQSCGRRVAAPDEPRSGP
jgi:integrase